MIYCLICNKQLLQITRNHLFRHNITVADYKKFYPNALLQDESIKLKGEKNPFFGKKHSDEILSFLKARESGIKKPQSFGDNISKKHNSIDSKLKKVMSTREYKESLSKGVKNWWNSLDKESRLKIKENCRISNEKNGNWIPLYEKEPFEAYTFEVRRLTEINFKQNFYLIENANLRGKKYDLDHMISIYDGFKQNISVEIISHYKNLRIIPSKDNQVKNKKSCKNYEMLLLEITDD